MYEKDLDTPGHSNRHAVVGPQSKESLWVLYPDPASLGLMRRLRVSRLSRTHPRETGLGRGIVKKIIETHGGKYLSFQTQKRASPLQRSFLSEPKWHFKDRKDWTGSNIV